MEDFVDVEKRLTYFYFGVIELPLSPKLRNSISYSCS